MFSSKLGMLAKLAFLIAMYQGFKWLHHYLLIFLHYIIAGTDISVEFYNLVWMLERIFAVFSVLIMISSDKMLERSLEFDIPVGRVFKIATSIFTFGVAMILYKKFEYEINGMLLDEIDEENEEYEYQ